MIVYGNACKSGRITRREQRPATAAQKGKLCPGCGRVLPPGAFYLRADTGGTSTRCKACTLARIAAKRAE